MKTQIIGAFDRLAAVARLGDQSRSEACLSKGGGLGKVAGRFGPLDTPREALEVGHALLEVEEFRLVGTEHRVAGEKRASEIFLASQFRIPPAVGNPDMSRLHRFLDGDLGNDLTVGGFQSGPLAIGDGFPRGILGVKEELREGRSLSQDFDISLARLEE